MVQNGLKKLQSVLTFERWEASDHLKDDTPQTPPIYTLVMSLLLDDFRSEILGSSTDRHGLFVLETESLAEPEVGDLDVSSFVKEHVLGL